MRTKQATATFTELFTTLYRHTYRRRDPRETRLSGEALAMLQHLRDSGPLTVTEAASQVDRSQAAISERIERLIERGLLERVRDERDRRRHFVWLTTKAEELLRVEFEVLDQELLSRAMRAMNDQNRRSLISGMRALVDACGRDATAKGRKR